MCENFKTFLWLEGGSLLPCFWMSCLQTMLSMVLKWWRTKGNSPQLLLKDLLFLVLHCRTRGLLSQALSAQYQKAINSDFHPTSKSVKGRKSAKSLSARRKSRNYFSFKICVGRHQLADVFVKPLREDFVGWLHQQTFASMHDAYAKHSEMACPTCH